PRHGGRLVAPRPPLEGAGRGRRKSPAGDRRQVIRWLSLLPLLVLVGLGALFGLYSLNRNPQVQPQALVGKPMPDLSLPALDDGRPVRLADLAAEGPLLVNFFASWCAPCEIEHPVLVGLQGQPVRLIGIAYKDAPTNTQAFLNRLGDPYV